MIRAGTVISSLLSIGTARGAATSEERFESFFDPPFFVSVMRYIICILAIFAFAIAAAEPPDPFNLLLSTFDFSASNYREPYIPLRRALEFSDFLCDNLIVSAIGEEASVLTIYRSAPYRWNTSVHVHLYLDNAEDSQYPADFSYNSIRVLAWALREFSWKWEDTAFVPTFDVRLRMLTRGFVWKGNFTQLPQEGEGMLLQFADIQESL